MLPVPRPGFDLGRIFLGFRMNTHTRTLFRIISRSQLCIAFVKQFGAGTFFQAKCLQRPRAVINFGAASGTLFPL